MSSTDINDDVAVAVVVQVVRRRDGSPLVEEEALFGRSSFTEEQEEKTQLSFETTSSLLCLSLCWTPIKFDIATLLFLSGARETIIFFFFQRPLLRQLLDNDDQQEFF